jgi:hypothetical protein
MVFKNKILYVFLIIYGVKCYYFFQFYLLVLYLSIIRIDIREIESFDVERFFMI